MNPLEIRDEFLMDARNDIQVALTLACYFIATVLPHISLGEIRAKNQSSLQRKPKPPPVAVDDPSMESR